jgi:lipopolysaccharide transport system ATP-binding protein
MGIIRVTNLGKAYKQYPTRWSRLAEWLTPGHKPRHTLKWVLQDINFTISPGEAVGIIGINGAGKSTLLKMITGTTQPTTGSVHISGRVAALLELGMGFHPDFTGRQNALMAGQLTGLSPEQTIELMPSIEQFADIGEYFDQPVRVYSSGMQARVAFAVATAARPDILIIDEALSVGDIAFQAKCMQRMNALLDSGTTVLFVSHGLNQIRQFCSKALYISSGQIKAFGPTDEVCDLYQNDQVGGSRTEIVGADTKKIDLLKISSTLAKDQDLRKNSVDGNAGGTLDLEFISFDILNAVGENVSMCLPGEKLHLKAGIIANREVPGGAAVGLLIADKTGYPLLSCNSNYYDIRLPRMKVGDAATMIWSIEWPFFSGEFRVDIGIKPDPHGAEFYDRVFCARTIAATTPVSLLRQNFGGYLHVHADVAVSLISNT